MKNKVLPTLSIFGMTSDPQIVTEKLFLYFITSEYSQSVTFYGKISSLKYILSKYATDFDELKTRIYETLIMLYKKYFDETDIDISIEEDGDNTNKYTLRIKIVTVDEDNVVSEVEELLKIDNAKITNILEIIHK